MRKDGGERVKTEELLSTHRKMPVATLYGTGRDCYDPYKKPLLVDKFYDVKTEILSQTHSPIAVDMKRSRGRDTLGLKKEGENPEHDKLTQDPNLDYILKPLGQCFVDLKRGVGREQAASGARKDYGENSAEFHVGHGELLRTPGTNLIPNFSKMAGRRLDPMSKLMNQTTNEESMNLAYQPQHKLVDYKVPSLDWSRTAPAKRDGLFGKYQWHEKRLLSDKTYDIKYSQVDRPIAGTFYFSKQTGRPSPVKGVKPPKAPASALGESEGLSSSAFSSGTSTPAPTPTPAPGSRSVSQASQRTNATGDQEQRDQRVLDEVEMELERKRRCKSTDLFLQSGRDDSIIEMCRSVDSLCRRFRTDRTVEKKQKREHEEHLRRIKGLR